MPYQIHSSNGGSGAPDDPFVCFNNYRVFEPFIMASVGGEYETLEQAKEAAQEHFRKFILSSVLTK